MLATGVPHDRRREALKMYNEVRGAGADEASALFDLIENKPRKAARKLDRLYRERGEIRLRNLALAAMHMALSPQEAQ